jgi:hypothetical protein
VVALGSKYSDAAAAEWELWRADVLRFSREAQRGSRLRSPVAVEAGLNPKSPLEFPNGLNALYSTEYYSGGSRIRSAGRVAEGMSAVQPFGYGYVDGLNIISFPYGQNGLSLATTDPLIETYRGIGIYFGYAGHEDIPGYVPDYWFIFQGSADQHAATLAALHTMIDSLLGGGGGSTTNWALIAVAGIVIIGGFALTRRKR